MKSNLKMQIVFADRVGIVADIATLMAELDVSIRSMEVEVDKGKAIVYLEAEKADKTTGTGKLLDKLKTIADFQDIALIQTLPQEKREKRFQVVLDSISDGILSINEEGKLVVLNDVAKGVLASEDQNVVGRKVTGLDLPDYSILECLEGKRFTNVRRDFISDKGRFQFLASGRPVVDSAGRIVGAVEVMKDMKEIKEMANAVSGSHHTTFSDIVGQGTALKEAILFAQKIARTQAIVTIRGESGTGKELFASAIHFESGRRGPFVPLNCAALPEQLLESELFGYVGGAFSGAKREGKVGLFETAGEGTIFLDEIAEMTLGLQAKMLRVIQEGRVRRVGGDKEVPVDVRIITATNKDLEQMVAEGRFREDLYYRINVFPIRIPPLRERDDDLPVLVEHFLFQLNSKLDKQLQSLTEEAMSKLTRHDWPGNVRELRNVIERAAILCSGERISVDCIRFGFEVGRGREGLAGSIGGPGAARPLSEMVEELEKGVVAATLRKAPSIRKAAKSLGISHPALLKKMQKYGLSHPFT